jgi:hypothetical protein
MTSPGGDAARTSPEDARTGRIGMCQRSASTHDRQKTTAPRSRAGPSLDGSKSRLLSGTGEDDPGDQRQVAGEEFTRNAPGAEIRPGTKPCTSQVTVSPGAITFDAMVLTGTRAAGMFGLVEPGDSLHFT